MSDGNKILILYASYGDGHRQVAAALEQQFAARGKTVVKVDLYERAHPLINAWMQYVYLKSFGIGSSLYGSVYYATRRLPRFVRPMFMFGLRELRQIVETERPGAIIATFPFSALSMLGRVQGIQPPRYTVITDFALHDLWVHPGVDGIFVATEELKRDLIRSGIEASRIHVSGIPLRPSFEPAVALTARKEAYGLDPARKTILIMAGAYGVSSETIQIVKELGLDNGLQLLVVCGRNERLLRILRQACAHCPQIHLYGYVDHIAELMAVSDCVVTKAGGITLSEALVMELPIAIFRPLPGQEKENAGYLSAKGAAIVADRTRDLVERVRQLAHHQAELGRMKRAIRRLRKVAAADRIAALIGEEMGERALESSELPRLRIDPAAKGAPHCS